MKLDYRLLDVFTRDQLAGNPLAVVIKADGMLDDQMQRVAAEFNLSETVFITKPQSERHTAAIRIFTPTVELPFAGHPTVGAAVLLGLETRSSAVRLEERVGVVTCLIERIDRRRGRATFALPHLPTPAGRPPDKRSVAMALGIDVEDIGWGVHQPSVYTAGVIFYLVPVKDAAVLRRLDPQQAGWREAFPLESNSVYAYTATPDEPGNDLAARMFGFGMGLGEDPATGAAAAALIGELAVDAGTGQTGYLLRQGVEMGRPSLITLQQIRRCADAWRDRRRRGCRRAGDARPRRLTAGCVAVLSARSATE